MPTTEIEIDNLKCGGCQNTITKVLSKIEGVLDAKINAEKSIVVLNHSESIAKKKLIKALNF